MTDYYCDICNDYIEPDCEHKCIDCDKIVCSDHSHNYIDICKECFLKLNSEKDWIEQEVNN